MDRFFDNYVMTPMQKIVFDRIRPEQDRDPYGVTEARAMLDKAYGWLDKTLAGREWAAGATFSARRLRRGPVPVLCRLGASDRRGVSARPGLPPEASGPALLRAGGRRGPALPPFFPLGAPDRD